MVRVDSPSVMENGVVRNRRDCAKLRLEVACAIVLEKTLGPSRNRVARGLVRVREPRDLVHRERGGRGTARVHVEACSAGNVRPRGVVNLASLLVAIEPVVEERAEKAGISSGTLKRASEEMGIVKNWGTWVLPL